MNWPTAFTYFWMVGFWVFGAAVTTGGKMIVAVLIPPIAWVFAVQWIVERFS